MKLTKKAVVFDVLSWFFKIFFLIVVLFSLVLLVRSIIVTELDIFNAEADLFIQRVLLSRNSISYYDQDIDRLYPGIIDLDKFMSPNINEILNLSMYYGIENDKVAAALTLKDDTGVILRTIIYNPDYYARWKEMLTASWIKGPGGVRGKTKSYEVLIKGTELRRGTLEIEVILPNS